MNGWIRLSLCFFCLLIPSISHAGPGDIIFSDDFDNGTACSALTPQWSTNNNSRAGISNDTASSANCSLFTRHLDVVVTSQSIDLNAIPGAQLTAWVRKGSDAFSEDPDLGEDLVLEYQNSSGGWIVMQTFAAGSIAAGGITNVNFNLPLAAFHSGFRLRWRQLTGSGADFDYWHIDDVLITETGAPPLPGLSANSCDQFENGLQNFVASDGNRVGTGSQTSNSPNNSLYLRHGEATATSVPINTLALSSITVWVRRGSDTFSENPDPGEDLVIEALDNSGNWIGLETFAGSGAQGQIFNRTYTPTASFRHANFQIRFRLTSASGPDFDYWHVDDVCFVSTPPSIEIEKTSLVLSDPVNGTINPKTIPGAIVRYTISIVNTASGTADPGSVVLSDVLDANTTLFVGDLGGGGAPFIFTDGSGANSTGLSATFLGLSSSADSVTFLNAANTSIAPTPDYDPNVSGFVITFDGPVNGTASGGTPEFLVEFNVRID